MNPAEISLGEFVKQLVAHLDEADLVMPLKDEGKWHTLFYKLRGSRFEGRPAFFDEMLFDWDGAYPRSPELVEYIHALHWTGCVSASNPQYDQITLNKKVRELWSAVHLDENLRGFVDFAVGLAKEEFNSTAQPVC
jgi:hypothetical protein